MKLIKTDTYKGKILNMSYACNVYTIRLFTKIHILSSNYNYNGKPKTFSECIKEL